MRAAVGETADPQALRICEGNPDHLFAGFFWPRYRVFMPLGLPIRRLELFLRTDTLHQRFDTGDLMSATWSSTE